MNHYLVDSHCHLNYLADHPDDLAPFIENAQKHNVQQMLCVGVNHQTTKPIEAIINRYPNVYGSVGVHPCDAQTQSVDTQEILRATQHEKMVAIGETGLDYYHKDTQKKPQHEAFIAQIELAKTTKLPLIVHTRSAKTDTLNVLKQYGDGLVQGVLHCFTEDWDMAKKGMDLGFYVSISGIVTFKNAHQVQEVAKRVPLDRLLVETDSPYLAPVPYRGKSNQPAYTHHVAESIAALRGIHLDTLVHQTTSNFHELFHKTVPHQ